MVLYCMFLVLVSVTVHRMYVQIVLVRSRLLCGHLWERAVRSVDPRFSLYYVYL